MEYVGSPEQVLKIQGSMNCQVCCEKGTYIEAMKKDSLNLFEGNVTVDVDYNLSNQEIIKKIADSQQVTPLPCPVDLISQPEAVAWLSVELKQDCIKQALKPVSENPWRKPSSLQSCEEFPPLGGLRKIYVYKQVIKNQLALKGNYRNFCL